jgi:hypothetical protein
MLRATLAPAAVLAALALLASTAIAAPPPSNSYRDSSQVLIDPETGQALAAPVRTPPETPSEADVQDCTSQLDSNDTGFGHVRNRFLWCTRAGIRIRNISDPSSFWHMGYTAIGYGRDDGTRDTTIFFRAETTRRAGSDPPDLGSRLTIGVECTDEYSGDFCHTDGGHLGSLLDWDLEAGDGVWRRFRVISDDPGPTFSGVLNHKWRFTADAVTEHGPALGGPDLPWHNIRCDSATYFHLGGERPKACIFDDVVPHLIYSISDTRVTEVAEHIRDAQNDPGHTWPLFASKSIPGKYLSGGQGLHRLPSGTPEYNENRRLVGDACQMRGEYAGNGIPPEFQPGPDQDCDEYPFASTFEGAGDDHISFSVRAVDHSQNCAAGALLGWYYTTDRILYDWVDEFWVEIRDTGAPPEIPPDVPPGGDEEEACQGIRPQPSPIPMPSGQIRISDVAVTEGDSGAQNATVTVSLNRPMGEPLSVSYATADNTATAPGDYQARSGRITFGPDERFKTISVPVNGDPMPEPDESFFIRLSNPSAGEILDGEARVTIRTDPEPALSINDVRIKEDDADLTFTASLTEANNTPVGVDFATAVTATAGADYDARTGRLDIPVGATSGTIVVHTREDFDDEIDEETFKVVLSNAVNVFVTDAEGVGTIRDDDRNGLFTCRATAARLGATAYRVANPAEHPCRDDNQANALLQIGLSGLGVSLRTGAATDQTPNDLRGTEPAVGDIAKSHAEATDVTITAGLNLIRIEGFVTDAAAECHNPPDAPRLTSASRIANLTLGGVPIPVGSNPVQVPLVLATLKLNETVRDRAGVTQRAVVLDQLLGPDLVLGEARAGWRGTAVHPDGHPCVV